MEIGDDDSVPSAQMVQISVGFGRRRIIPESFATGFGSAAAALADHLVLNVKEGIAWRKRVNQWQLKKAY